MSNERLVMVSVTTLESLISMARSHVEDIESGVEEGIYQASENQDVGGKKSAIELAEGTLLEALNGSGNVAEELSLVYETYVCHCADGTIEWGYCFKQLGSDDVEFDLAIAGAKLDEATDARMQADFARLEWAAKAVCAAPGHSAALAKVDQAFDGLNSLLDSSGALEAEGTQRAVYTLRLAIVEALGDELRISAARDSLVGMKTFEVTGYGFDASTDSTDDRVFWVKAQNHDEVRQALAGTNATFHDTIDADDSIDYYLPAQAGLLNAKLLEFEVDLPQVMSRNAIAVTFESRWEEGVVSTGAYLDLDSGIVFDIEDSAQGAEFEHLIGEFVLIGDREVAVQMEPDDNYRIDAPTLAFIKVEVDARTAA